MQVTAKLNGARISAQKVRLVADQVRGMPVEAGRADADFRPAESGAHREEGAAFGHCQRGA